MIAFYNTKIKKEGGTALLYNRCWVSHCNLCDKFDFNDIKFKIIIKENDSHRKRYVSLDQLLKVVPNSVSCKYLPKLN